MQELFVELIGRFGYLAVTVLIAVENLFPPIPSELILTFAGFMTTKTGMTVFGAAFFATIGSVAGAAALYRLGGLLARLGGASLASRRWSRWVLIDSGGLARAGSWFARHGAHAVFFCRMLPIVRSLISLPAGMSAMPMGRFFALTGAGAFLWNLCLCSLGALLGNSWQQGLLLFERYAHWALVCAAVAAYLFWLLRRRRQRR